MTAEQLDTREDALWQDVLALSMLLPSAIDEEMRREADLSLFEFSMLAMLARRDDLTDTMSSLARATHSSASRLSHAATRLEERGLLARTACPTDGRSVYARLTDAGLEKVRCSVPVHTAGIRRLVLDGLTEEDRADLARILGRLLSEGGFSGDACRS
ncbi:MarR family winged helix-turn-helix transcriptional regulator [Demequina zhanjiangensis]|uniref:MarR family transcriptional regulator n=1 Tax=Demequina zhanjiangensis TaxID=3051659 RepID=A0ABT8G1A7_9MICO|nr:MarR family transcriptional regulator [Demequina sp. SYSU T00b26]MDN4472921.1 MarR family transcriptional regulator [Demequina sp. SYSU T00b26]